MTHISMTGSESALHPWLLPQHWRNRIDTQTAQTRGQIQEEY